MSAPHTPSHEPIGGLDTDPDALLEALQTAGGQPPLRPLRIAPPPGSARPGLAGRAVNGVRAALIRLLSPALADLITQLERDRHRQRAELERLSARVAELERRR